ncbi:hypothetical protein ACFORL_02160 [Legionella dresdenensis]|uniref:Uncharacterized protein n=1 Tax=Legionella dresdenensis TaxID=450200 RepID=A0ABV8CC47_9GAMM
MNKLKLICFASLLSVGVSHASTLCNGFQIKIRNNLPHAITSQKITLSNGAVINPNNDQTIPAHSERVYVVENTPDGALMFGKMNFKTDTNDAKKIKLKFTLEGKLAICEHDDKTTETDYPVEKTRSPGQVTYTIG